MGTIQQDGGAPLVTLVTVATDSFGTPILLLSDLAWHTKNLKRDERASLLIDGTGPSGDPLEGIRVSLWGTVAPVTDSLSKARFLAHQPASDFYIGSKDFSLYKLHVEGGHSIGGFGRIVTFPAGEFILDGAQHEAVAAAESGIIDHMNEDHSDAVALYAVKLMGAEPGDWKMTGCDPDGCDLVKGQECVRLAFERPAKDAGEVRKNLVDLVKKARALETLPVV